MFFNNVDKICDKAIIEFSKGNNDSLSTIYDCMARLIFSSAYAILNNYQDSEDVLQDTMIHIAKNAHQYKSGSYAKSWILSITRNLSIDILRKRKNTVPMDEEMLDNDLQSEEDEFSNLEVNDILNILDEEERQIIIFRLYAKLPYKEITKIMSINVPTLHKKYQRAIKKLKINYDGGL